MLDTLDLIILSVYLLTILIIGLVLRRRAQKSTSDYLLGGKTIPWYLLGLSNASGMFDISGTIWLVTLLFVYGFKSAWIPWLWPIFNQVFLMVYLSKWIRRSNVTTGAEWIRTRFGYGKGGNLSHTIIVIFALVSCLGFLAYGFIGLGKFIEIFIPWELISAYIPFEIPRAYAAHFYGIVFTLFASLYALMGGMRGIVWADVIQFGILSISALVITYLGYTAVGSQPLRVPDGWNNPFFGLTLDLDWTNIIPQVNDKIREDGYSLFSLFFMMMLFKGILVSMAGPAPNYDLQKILSAKSPEEASKMSGLVSVLLMPVRYLMIAGFAALALLFYQDLDLQTPAGQLDFELILPASIKAFAPAGLLGLLLASLLAAFMSTFAGTLNAAQAYLINDLYLSRTPANRSSTSVKWLNYGSGILVITSGILLGFYIENVNSVLQWLVSALFGSYVVANLLKWHWWRLNGEGFFWGMVGGMVPALVLPLVFSQTLDLYYFPLILIFSLLGCLAGTYSSPPTDEKVLHTFYKNIRPWGLWQPVLRQLQSEEPQLGANKNFKRDILNVTLGIGAQSALVLLPIAFVFREWEALLAVSVCLLACLAGLWKYWWKTLYTDDA